MFSSLPKLLGIQPVPAQKRPQTSLFLEHLEDRTVPTVTMPKPAMATAPATAMVTATANSIPANTSVLHLGDTNSPPQNTGTALTFGFWKTHTGFGPQANAWPTGEFSKGSYVGDVDSQGRANSSMVIGAHTYSFTELQTILATPAKGDALINLGHQLIPAILNVVNGAGTTLAVSEIKAASDLLGANHLVIGLDKVTASNPLYSQFVTLTSELDAFNSSGA